MPQLPRAPRPTTAWSPASRSGPRLALGSLLLAAPLAGAAPEPPRSTWFEVREQPGGLQSLSGPHPTELACKKAMNRNEAGRRCVERPPETLPRPASAPEAAGPVGGIEAHRQRAVGPLHERALDQAGLGL